MPTVPAGYRFAPEVIRELLASHPDQWPSFDDRETWELIGESSPGSVYRERLLKIAEATADQWPPLPLWSQALEFRRSGERYAWQGANSRLSHRLGLFVLTACFTGEERWLLAAGDAIWAAAELNNWVSPAHRACETDESPGFDLGSATRAQELAEAVRMLGPALDRLDPRFTLRMRQAVKERALLPYLERDDYWFLKPRPPEPINNWTAVCGGGALAAALGILDSEAELQARVVAKAIWSLSYFREAFGPRGSLDEGVGYWAYGFSFYAMAAERLLARTGGEIDLLPREQWEDVARFPAAVHLYGHKFLPFSDCAQQVRPHPGWLAYLGQKMQVPEISQWAARRYKEILAADWSERSFHLPSLLRELLWHDHLALHAEAVPERRFTFLDDIHWFVFRSDSGDDALVLGGKGGHNHENHNHNDGGSFVVSWAGRTFIDEIGAPSYDRFFFSPTRYENIAARSLGHSVPFPNGVEQAAGREYEARMLGHAENGVSLDLRGLYPEAAGLAGLTRQFRMVGQGDQAAIEVTDRAEFLAPGGTLACPLILRDAEVALPAPGEALVSVGGKTMRISWPTEQASARVEVLETRDARFLTPEGKSRLSRLWLEVAVTDRHAVLDLRLAPHQPPVAP